MLNKYYFTFGCGHLDSNGNSLGNSYCIIYAATSEEAREHMRSARGDKYCTNYMSAQQAGVDRFELTQVHLEDVIL